MAIALAVALCLGSGFVLVSIGWRRFTPHWIDLLLRGSLAVGLGLGISSCIFFLGRVFGVRHFVVVDCAVFLVLLTLERRTPRPPGNGVRDSQNQAPPFPNAVSKQVPNEPGRHWLQPTLLVAFWAALCGAVYAAIMHTLAHPEGYGWDSFAIWNLRARFLFRGGNEHWQDGFSQLLPWSHPDYPLLLPASIAHFWSYLGGESVAVPALIGLAFTFSTVGMLFSSLAILRGRTHATLAAILLLTTPAFIQLGTSQYADVPLSFFLLGAVVLLGLSNEVGTGPRGLVVLGGISAGFAAWTKNEGLLFAEALIVASLFELVRKKYSGASRRNFVLLLVELLPLLVLIFGYKHWIAGPGDLFSSPAEILDRLKQPARYGIVLQWFAKDLLRFGGWFAIPGTILLLVFYFVVNRGTSWLRVYAHATSVLALAITLAGYFGIYLITPHDLYWHLRFSLDRLFLQLWPSAIFLALLAIRSPFALTGVSK